jgi:hypothetical protein
MGLCMDNSTACIVKSLLSVLTEHLQRVVKPLIA